MDAERQQPNEPQQPPTGDGTFTFKRSFSFGRRPPTAPADPPTALVPSKEHTFRWELRPGAPDEPAPAPRTYYEALTSEPHPATDFLVSGRRLLNLVVWAVALALPVGLVVAGIVAGEPLQTIVLMGAFGAIVGMLLRHSIPRTPFG